MFILPQSFMWRYLSAIGWGWRQTQPQKQKPYTSRVMIVVPRQEEVPEVDMDAYYQKVFMHVMDQGHQVIMAPPRITCPQVEKGQEDLCGIFTYNNVKRLMQESDMIYLGEDFGRTPYLEEFYSWTPLPAIDTEWIRVCDASDTT